MPWVSGHRAAKTAYNNLLCGNRGAEVTFSRGYLPARFTGINCYIGFFSHGRLPFCTQAKACDYFSNRLLNLAAISSSSARIPSNMRQVVESSEAILIHFL